MKKKLHNGETGYQLFVNGEFNRNWPNGFNFFTMRIERNRKETSVYLPDIEIQK